MREFVNNEYLPFPMRIARDARDWLVQVILYRLHVTNPTDVRRHPSKCTGPRPPRVRRPMLRSQWSQVRSYQCYRMLYNSPTWSNTPSSYRSPPLLLWTMAPSSWAHIEAELEVLVLVGGQFCARKQA